MYRNYFYPTIYYSKSISFVILIEYDTKLEGKITCWQLFRKKNNVYEYEPHQGTRLNDGRDIRITIINEDHFIHPSDCFLCFEDELAAKETCAKYLKTETGISFIRNALMHLFKRIEYSIDNDRIEDCNNPGQATTMKWLFRIFHVNLNTFEKKNW